MADKKPGPRIVKPMYFGNWGDIWGFPLAAILLPLVTKISFLTPNVITLIAFSLYAIGSISLFLDYRYHLIVAGIFLPLGFLGDDLDGQVARARKLSSVIGDYLDKVLDVLKIFIVTASLGYAVYLQTGNALYMLLGFATCFFFNYRYYIKLESVFSSIDRDPAYLEKCSIKRNEIEENLNALHDKLWKTPVGKLQSLWLKHRLIFAVDEAEIAVFTGVGALFNQLELALWILAISQVTIAIWRVFERGYQLSTYSEKLLLPMRK